MSNKTKFILLFLFFYIFRTLFGLSLTFFGSNPIENDALQTYLIGLKCYTTQTWPYFGPDQYRMDTGFHSQLPGALEGLVVGLPFYILPIPEAPFLFINLLSLLAIALISWYIVKRLPEFSYFFVFSWISLLPWTLNRSTNILNPCFLLFGSVLFFLGFFETLPRFSMSLIKPRTAYVLMGFGIFWNMQFHLSYVLLLPLLALDFLWRRKERMGNWMEEIGAFFLGAVFPLCFLLPTLVKYGFFHGSEGLLKTSALFNFDNFKNFLTILARYLSFPCYEMPRFLGSGTSERWGFVKQALWLAPPAIFLWLLGLLQPFVLLIWGWFKDERHSDSKTILGLTMGTLLWVWVCFWFTSNGIAAHMYYVLLPLTVVYSFYIWSRLAPKKGWRTFGMVCLVASLWFQTGFIIQKMKTQSLYANRDKIVKALDQKDYRLLSERRDWGVFY